MSLRNHQQSCGVAPGWNTLILSDELRKGGELLKLCGIRIPLLGLRLLRVGILLFHQFELIKERLVADLKNLGRLPAVPSRFVQDFLNGFTLCLHSGAPADLKQRWSVVIEMLRV